MDAMSLSMVRPPYKSAFIIPFGAKRVLTDCGWDFSSDRFLSERFSLQISKNLPFTEEFLNIQRYENSNMTVDVFRDDEAGKIELIDLRFYGLEPQLPEFLHQTDLMTNAEFFVPSHHRDT